MRRASHNARDLIAAKQSFPKNIRKRNFPENANNNFSELKNGFFKKAIDKPTEMC